MKQINKRNDNEEIRQSVVHFNFTRPSCCWPLKNLYLSFMPSQLFTKLFIPAALRSEVAKTRNKHLLPLQG
jgi:hypothetical protein